MAITLDAWKVSMDKLTNRQAEVLELIKDRIAEWGYPPTRADIAKALRFKSPNAAEEHLKALHRKGHIEIVPGTSRGIRLVAEAGLPIVGRVAAGDPILAVEHIEDSLDVPADMFRPTADFLLRVNGDSMKDIGILDGDLLAVHQTRNVRSGDVVVARIEDEVTVKRLRRKSRDKLLLLPENEDFEPIEVNLRRQEFQIEGLSVGVIRREM